MTPRAATFLMFVVNGAVVGTWLASIPGIQASLNASATEIGLVLLFAAAGALLSQQVTGQLLTRISSRHVLLGTSFIFPLLTPLPLLAPSPLALAAVMFAFGAVNTAMDVTMNAHGVALEQSGGKSIFSGLHAGWSIGGIIGAVGVGIAVTAGVAGVAEALVAALLLWLVVLVAGRFLGTGSVKTEGASGISWPSRAVLPVALLIALIAFVEGGLSDWGGIYLRRGLGSTAEVAAFAYAALSLGLTIGRLGGDTIKDRIGSIRLIQVGMLLAAVAIPVMLLIGDAIVALLGLVV
ncbi:MAG: MFS transporter, partial [Chloroflexota bacterium]